MTEARELLKCERCSVYLLDQQTVQDNEPKLTDDATDTLVIRQPETMTVHMTFELKSRDGGCQITQPSSSQLAASVHARLANYVSSTGQVDSAATRSCLADSAAVLAPLHELPASWKHAVGSPPSRLPVLVTGGARGPSSVPTYTAWWLRGSNSSPRGKGLPSTLPLKAYTMRRGSNTAGSTRDPGLVTALPEARHNPAWGADSASPWSCRGLPCHQPFQGILPAYSQPYH
ncbi:hypothetical protein O3P69_019164 [Scylla paramamosain]|uniref:Uncharacterized protein n=1 Tax=Scylla paramamosain TaxID=85552 RepID=A0AAW0SVN8_SCYPA